MKIIKYISMLVLIMMMLTSCNSEQKDLFDEYTSAKKNISNLDSFTKDENVNISLKAKDKEFGGKASTNLKYINSDKDIWEITFNIGTMDELSKAYYEDWKLYIDISGIKATVELPSFMAKPNVLSLSTDYDKKKLISSEVTNDNGSEKTVTFVFSSDNAIDNIKKFTKYNMTDIEILNITPSNITVVATYNNEGLLLSENSTLETDVTIKVNGEEHSATLVYSNNSTNSNFNQTTIVKPDVTSYKVFKYDEIKQKLEELNILNFIVKERAN